MSLNAARAELTRRGKAPGRGRTKRRGGAGVAGGVNLSLGVDRLLGVTQTLRRELVCTISGEIIVTGGAYAENTLILNTAYHLDSGTTNSKGFLAYMDFYQKCWVLSSRVRIRGVAQSVTAGVHPWSAVSIITTNGTSLGSVEAAINNGLADWVVGFGNPDRFGFDLRVDHAKFLGKPKYLDDPQLFCTTSTAPGQVIVWHLGVKPRDGSDINFYYTVEIVQSVVFTDPIPFT